MPEKIRYVKRVMTAWNVTSEERPSIKIKHLFELYLQNLQLNIKQRIREKEDFPFLYEITIFTNKIKCVSYTYRSKKIVLKVTPLGRLAGSLKGARDLISGS